MLTKLEELEDEINNEGISLINKKTLSVKAAAIKHDNKHTILYDPNKLTTQAERHTVLLHEYCHIQNDALYSFNDSLQTRRRREYKAKKAMVLKLITSDKLKEKLKKGHSKWEIAEELCVTEDVIDDAVRIYKNMGEM